MTDVSTAMTPPTKAEPDNAEGEPRAPAEPFLIHDGAASGPIPRAPAEPQGLPRLTFFLILAAVVALFLLGRGPFWRQPWNIDALDSAIFWSYVPIPFLVLIGLYLARRFSWRFLFLDTLLITLIKYAITFSIAMVLWLLNDPPPRAPAEPASPRAAAAPAPAPPPTPIAPEQRGAVRGTVKDAAGQPVAGAFVFVAAGLEAFVFERPSAPVHVENDGAGVRPPLVIARAGQEILGRSLDGHLHTLVASGDSAGTTFNIPMMSSGAWSTVVVHEPAKLSRLRCTVHPTGEAPAHLVVLDHPFFTSTGADGTFRLEGVPAAKISVSAWHAPSGEAQSSVEVAGRSEAIVDLSLAKHEDR
jgi:hypothetical protein